MIESVIIKLLIDCISFSKARAGEECSYVQKKPFYFTDSFDEITSFSCCMDHAARMRHTGRSLGSL